MPNLPIQRKLRRIEFTLFGIRVEIFGTIADDLAADFSYFMGRSNPESPDFLLQLEVILGTPPPPSGKQTQAQAVFPDCVQYLTPFGLLLDYHGKASLLVQEEKAQCIGTLYCAEPALARELGYLFLQSKIGKFLEAKNLFRVHGLGFSTSNDNATLFLAPSGGGKTTLTQSLIELEGTTIFSEDTPILDLQGNLHPYPLSHSLRNTDGLPSELKQKVVSFQRRKHGTKYLIPVEHLSSSSLPAYQMKSPLRTIVIANRWINRDEPAIRKPSPSRAFHCLSRDLIVGLGIPQIAELILTKGTKSFAEMIPGMAKKTMLTARLLKQCRFLELDLCNNSRRNAEFLLKEIK